ncbi:MAG: methylamine dehydrogenase accessory protein MauD [Steroidobacteraceae bacterium]
MELLSIVVTVLFIVVLGLVVALWALSRQVGILFERVSPLGALVTDSGPAVGAEAPLFELPSLFDSSVVRIGGSNARSTLLFFLSPNCPVCKKMLPVLRSLEATEGSWVRLVLASDGNEAEHRRFAESHNLQRYPYVLSTQMGMTFRVTRLPFAVLIGEDGLVKSKGLINNREQIESLFNAKELGVPSVQKFIEQSHLTPVV